MKMALLAGAAVAASAAAAHADQLQDLKAQVEALNARVAAMEASPSVPAGYQLVTISKGDALVIPGLGDSDTDRVKNDSARIISVLPTADAPAGTQISWSGYVNAAIVYRSNDASASGSRYTKVDNTYVKTASLKDDDPGGVDYNDWDVRSRGQLRVVASTDTAVGEVGVELKMRADFNGNGSGDVYMKTAWGYWAMTPELTLGGGYTSSLGKIGYGYDGACTCYYTDNADVGFDPGYTSQMRLSYGSGPFSMAVAIEDSGLNNGFGQDNYNYNYKNLGAAGRVMYSGDAFSGEIAGLYRSTNDDSYPNDSNIDGLWQVGAGLSFNMGDIASLSLAAAMGEGPYTTVNDSGDITNSLPIYNQWWGVSGLASANLSDTVHAEVAAGYKHREGDKNSIDGQLDSALPAAYDPTVTWDYQGFDYDTYAFLGGLYYTPVDQLTIGVEGEWYQQNWDFARSTKSLPGVDVKDKLSYDRENWTVDLVSVWRF